MTTLTKLQSVLGGLYTFESAIMPSMLAKSLFTGQIALGYDYIATDYDKKIHSALAFQLEKFVIGDNWGTFFLNKGIESYLGIGKFIAQETNKGVYEVVPELSKPNEAEAEAKAMTEEKYWQQRYRFFSKFDEGVQLDSGLKPNFLPP